MITPDRNPESPILVPGPPSQPPSCCDEDDIRNIWWIHGFGGDDTSLSKARLISTINVPHPEGGLSINQRIGYPARNINSFAPSYETGEDLQFYGFDIGQEINITSINLLNQTEEEAFNNFAITSSWGGNVTRMANLLFNEPGNGGFRLGGIVSMGGSHIGAELADNLLTTLSEEDAFPTDDFGLIDLSSPGDVRLTDAGNNFLVEANESLIEGPLCDALDGNILLSFLARTDGGERALGAVTAVANELITSLPSVLGNGLFSRTGLSLQTDNPQQGQLNNGDSTTVNVAGYGVEDEELGMWRLFYWGRNNPNNIPTQLPTYTEDGQGFFEAISDEFALETFERNLTAYQIRQSTAEGEAALLQPLVNRCGFNFFSLVNIGKCADALIRHPKLLQTAQGYERGIEWFQNSSDFWHELTGALTFEEVILQTGTCTCGSGPTGEPDPNFTSFPCHVNEIGSIQCDGFFNFIPDTGFSEVRRESDAVVLAESAMAFPGAVHIFRMPGSNHFNMRNDNNTQTLLFDVFSGDPGLGLQYFETPEKN